MAATDASRRLSALQARESPEIGVLGRSSREAGNNYYDNRIGIQFRFPFATEARNTAIHSDNCRTSPQRPHGFNFVQTWV